MNVPFKDKTSVTMLGIGTSIGILFKNHTPTWNEYWSARSVFWAKSRDSLSLTDVFGSDAKILPYSLKFNGASGYFTYNDAGALNIGTGDLTCGGYFGVYEDVTPSTEEGIWGKTVLNNILNGSYGFFMNKTTKKIGFFAVSSGGFNVVYSNAGIGEYHHFMGEVDNTNKKIRILVDNVQYGTDVTFTGTFSNPNKPVMLGICQSYNSSSYERPGRIICGCAYIYNKLLTPTEKTSIINGEHVSGAGIFILPNHPLKAFDVSGNNRDIVYTHISSYGSLDYSCPYSYILNYGYTLAKWDNETEPYEDAILVPAVNGTHRVTPTLPASYTLYNEVDGDLSYINNFFGGIRFPAGVMDRSDTTQFNAACRASSFYNAADPTLWDMSELQYDVYKSYVNASQIKDFALYDDDNAVFGRRTLKELLTTISPQTGANLTKAEGYFDIKNKTIKVLEDNVRPEWENCSYYFNGKHYRVWTKGQADNWDKYIYTIDENMIISDSYLCADGCLATTDYHAMPTVIVDDSGYIYVIHEQMDGNVHGSDMLVFKSDNPEDITAFTQIQEISGVELVYPQLTKLNGEIFCYFRDQNGENIVIYKLNTGTDEFEYHGKLYDAIAGASYKAPLQNKNEDKLGLVFYEIDSAESEAIYYAESIDGDNWTNADGSVSVDITNGEYINGPNKASFVVHEDSVGNNSIISENGLLLNGVPIIVIYEGNTVGGTEITVNNVYLATFTGGSWVKRLLPYTTPMEYAQRGGFNHFLTYKNGIYYLFFLYPYYGDDLLNNSQVKLYKSSNLITWTEEVFSIPDYGYIFAPCAFLTPNAPLNNNLIWFWVNQYDYVMNEVKYSIHYIYKL